MEVTEPTLQISRLFLAVPFFRLAADGSLGLTLLSAGARWADCELLPERRDC